MKKLGMLFLAALLLAGCSTAPAQKTDAELEAEGWVKNPEANGYIKMEDALTTASVAIDESQQLSQPEIRDLALDYLRGWPLKPMKQVRLSMLIVKCIKSLPPTIMSQGCPRSNLFWILRR